MTTGMKFRKYDLLRPPENVLLAEERQPVEAGDIARPALDVERDAVFSRRRVVRFVVEPDREFWSERFAWNFTHSS